MTVVKDVENWAGPFDGDKNWGSVNGHQEE